jgi:hypothetical protein
MLASKIERAHRLAPSDQHSGEDRFSEFRQRNLRPLEAAIDRATRALLGAPPSDPAVQATARLAFIEPSPYFPNDMWHDVAGELKSRDWTVRVATRLHPDSDTIAASQTDWNFFCRSTLAIVDVRGPEVAPGAALMIGACAAVGRPVVAGYSVGWQTFADGREPNWRNLMIQYAVQGCFTDVRGLIALTDAL